MRYMFRFLLETEGATSVEYAVMIALILSVCLGALRVFGVAVGNSFAASAQEMQNYFPSGS
jgi:Flp pilus assembly pilin Flp